MLMPSQVEPALLWWLCKFCIWRVNYASYVLLVSSLFFFLLILLLLVLHVKAPSETKKICPYILFAIF